MTTLDTNVSASPPAPPTYRLFSPHAVLLAVVLGSPIAGAAVIGINYWRLGNRGKAFIAVILGILATAIGVLIGSYIPTSMSTGISFGLAFGTFGIAKQLQGETFHLHTSRGGAKLSNWWAAGIAIVVALIMTAGIFGYFLLFAHPPGTRLTLTTGDSIYYSGTASEQDARALGNSLVDIGMLTGKDASVGLSKSGSGTVFSFTVNDGSWNDYKIIEAFRTIGEMTARKLGGRPVTVRLLNTEGDVKRELVVN